MHGFGLWEESKNPRRHENNMQTPHRNVRSLLNPWPPANAAKNHWASMPPTFFELFTGNTRCRTKLWLCKICLSCCGKEYVTRRADYRTNTLLGKKTCLRFLLIFCIWFALLTTALCCTHLAERLNESFCLCLRDTEAKITRLPLWDPSL